VIGTLVACLWDGQIPRGRGWSARRDEGSTILFAMVADPARRSLTIASGHACTGAFETFGLDDFR
jgi:hypothetical protein